tara:strand:- start:1122 stop:2189 length:1068 start_codon:yes stop_codon:yes gene_type:complete
MNLRKLIQFLNRTKSKKILLVTGKKSYRISGAENFINQLPKEFRFITFNDFSENPKFIDAVKGAKIFKNKDCDAVIAVGGGSVMDMGKLICYIKELNIYQPNLLIQPHSIASRSIPFACIPTTAGSGSEATHFSVAYHNKVKYSVSNPNLIPDLTIIDPEFSFQANQYQRTVSGLDALSQSIESFWSKKSTKKSRIYSEESLNLIWNNLYDSVIRNNFNSHRQVVIGSHLAGKAINIAKTTAPHALSYYFTQIHNIKHGHAVILTLPKIYYLNRLNALNSNHKIKNIFSTLDSILGVVDDPISTIKKFIYNLNIEVDYCKLGISIKNELEEMKLLVNSDRLNNNPFKIDIEEVFN